MIIVVFTISKNQTILGCPKCTLRCYSWSVSTKAWEILCHWGEGAGCWVRFLSLLMLQTWWQWFPTLAAQLASHWSLGLAPRVSNKIGLDARTLQVGHGQPGKWAWTKSQTVTIYFLLLFSNQIPKYFNTLAALCEELIHWKRPDAGKDWGQEEKGVAEDEMVGWHHQLTTFHFKKVKQHEKANLSKYCQSVFGIPLHAMILTSYIWSPRNVLPLGFQNALYTKIHF